jgi:hypothetical protein
MRRRRREITRLISSRVPLRRYSSFGPPDKSDIHGFRTDDCPISARPDEFRRRGALPVAAPADTSKRRIRDRGWRPADKAAHLPALSLRLAGRIAQEACHPCVAKTS